jgi:hypothetical protein
MLFVKKNMWQHSGQAHVVTGHVAEGAIRHHGGRSLLNSIPGKDRSDQD